MASTSDVKIQLNGRILTNAQVDGGPYTMNFGVVTEVAGGGEAGMWSDDFQEFSLRMRADTQDGKCNIFALQVLAPPSHYSNLTGLL